MIFTNHIAYISYEFTYFEIRNLMAIPKIKNKTFIVIGVHLVLHPRGIALTILNLDSWLPGAGFVPILSTKGINQIKKGKMEEKS